jgi:serine phosphatase RsbU (regulator of sigma subunit)
MKGDVIEYNFFLEGAMDEWSGWTTDKKYTANNLREGKYVFHVKSKNVFGVESRPVIYEFQVKPPWYRTIWAWAAYVIVFLTILYLFVKWYTHRLRMEKLRLEKIVADRTAEINSQKEKIEVQNREITDSIHYAQRIQDAVLPADAKISQLLSEYFIFFKPRDIVSGDFFWISERKNKIIIAAADCTGHGVPGAFMSMLGVSFLNEIITHSKLDSASELLNILRERVKNTLGQEGKENEAKDGMDMALCIIDYEAMTLQYAGAYNPLYFFKDGEFNQVKADKCPIGIHAKEIPSFTNHIIPLQKGDTFYIFSDGFQDQFGGPKGRKFMSVPFKRLLSGIHEKPLKEQERIIQATYDDWRGDHEQVDDILIIGFRT